MVKNTDTAESKLKASTSKNNISKDSQNQKVNNSSSFTENVQNNENSNVNSSNGYVNNNKEQNPEPKKSKFDTAKQILVLLAMIPGIIFGFILLMIVIFIIMAMASSDNSSSMQANTAVINIRGYISVDEESSFYSSGGTSSQNIQDIVEQIKKDKNIKAVIFDINSGGGSPVGSDEIMSAIKDLEDNGITTVAVIREVGASGAYWIASGTDHIVASRLSIVGSVGVIGSYLDFSGFLEEHNVTYQRLVAGEHKDAQTPFRELKDDELVIIQDRLDTLHKIFLDSVKENRNLTDEQVERISKADIFLGDEALEINLIDEIGGEKEAVKYLENKLNMTVKTSLYTYDRSFFDKLIGVSNENSYLVGKGIGSALLESKSSSVKFTT